MDHSEGGSSILERAAEPLSPLKTLPFGLRGLTLPTIDSPDRRDLLAPLKAIEARNRGGLPAHWSGQRRPPAGHFAGLQFFSDRVDASAWPWRTGEQAAMLAATLADIETVFAERATTFGVTIRRGCAVEAVEQHADRVVDRSGVEPFKARWLVGCDGARSVVRKAAGIGFVGTEPEFTGYSALLRLAEPHLLTPGRHHTATGMYTFTPPGTITMAEYDGGIHHRAELSRAMSRACSGGCPASTFASMRSSLPPLGPTGPSWRPITAKAACCSPEMPHTSMRHSVGRASISVSATP